MSYTEVYRFGKDGKARLAGEARNSHGFAPYIWQKLGEKYGILRKGEPYFDKTEQIWALFANDSTEFNDRIVLGTTFDDIVVPKEGLHIVIEALQKFIEEFPYNTQGCTAQDDTFLVRLPERVIEELAKGTINLLIEILQAELENPETIAIAFNVTSVNDGVWEVCHQGKNGHWYRRAYNLKTDSRHHFLLQKK